MTRVGRIEDDALLRGEGRYVDDLDMDQLRVAFVRAPLAHGRITSIDTSAARQAPGVVAVCTAADLGVGPVRAHAALPEVFDRPPLAADVVRFVGEPVAVVVAESQAAAVDAAELVEVDYEPMPAVVDPVAALQPGSTVVIDGHGSNLAVEGGSGTEAEVLAGADVVVRGQFLNQRVAPAPMEPDGALAAPDPDTGGVRLWVSTQRVHQVRDAIARCLALDQALVRVVAPQVGGGFGGKFEPAPEHVVVAALALRLGRPVAWTQTRTENLLGMPHGRGQVQEGALGLTADGRFTGIWFDVVGDAGAYPTVGALIPGATMVMAPGTYRFERAGGRWRAALTTTTPVGAFRGAGRPEASALLERLVDLAAEELGVDPVELRRQNLVGADAFPFTSATGMPYDSGDYHACLDGATTLLDYEAVRAEQAARRASGDPVAVGVGVVMWIDCTPMNRPGELAYVDLLPPTDGGHDVRVVVRDGAGDQGQAHATTWGLLLAERLGIPLSAIELEQADTGRVAHGEGTGSARSLMLAGNAVAAAGDELLVRGRALAADLLEASPDDVVVVDGRLSVVGSPAVSVGWDEIVAAAGGSLSAEVDFTQPGPTFPAGAHASVVEVDVETGHVRVGRFVAVDDCGVVINPVVVEGQQQGGIAQGIAQALFEHVTHDDDGNPLTTTFADYGIPSAAELPGIEAHTVDVRSPVNPLGSKGIGQAGAIGSTPAIQNAVVDALAHLGVRHVDLPMTPERVWLAIQAATATPDLRPTSNDGRIETVPSDSTSIDFDDLESRPGFFATKAAREGRPKKVTFLPDPDRQPRWCTLISVDDHLVEPPHLFEGRLPAAFADRAPRVEIDDDGMEYWSYDGNRHYKVGLNAVVGRPQDELSFEPTRFDEMRRGAWDIDARVHDMDINGVYASLNFPSSLAGFAGQRYQLGVSDPDLALAVVRAANDWHLEEWAGTHPGRIIPLQLPWLLDPEVAAEEVRRNAERGFRALTFPELPERLGLPSLHTGYWDPLMAACAETGTVVCLHVGSSSTAPTTSSDAPSDTIGVLFFGWAMFAAVDWLYSRLPVRFPDLEICLSEGGLGWVAGLMDRLDHVGRYQQMYGTWEGIDLTPREVLARNFWFCTIDDPSGLDHRHRVGVDHILLESDYPHQDGTWPDTQKILHDQIGHFPADDIRKLTWENAAKLFDHPVPDAVQHDPEAY